MVRWASLFNFLDLNFLLQLDREVDYTVEHKRVQVNSLTKYYPAQLLCFASFSLVAAVLM